MKKIIFAIIAVLSFMMTQQISAQKTEMHKKSEMMEKTKTVKLEQTTGEFNKKSLKLKAGIAYQFEVTNNGVDHEVGFVIAPSGKTDQKNHIQAAYLSETIADGKTANSGNVILDAGEYVYFCPMNPTPEYKIIVK